MVNDKAALVQTTHFQAYPWNNYAARELQAPDNPNCKSLQSGSRGWWT